VWPAGHVFETPVLDGDDSVVHVHVVWVRNETLIGTFPGSMGPEYFTVLGARVKKKKTKL
jgi:hypothetical protein